MLSRLVWLTDDVAETVDVCSGTNVLVPVTGVLVVPSEGEVEGPSVGEVPEAVTSTTVVSVAMLE